MSENMKKLAINVSINDKDFVHDVLTNNTERQASNGEKVTLFWSGGVDSTYMLLWLLAHGYEVHTVYCEVENNSFKVKRENWARKKIKAWVDEHAPGLADNWKHREAPLSVINIPAGDFRASLAQAPIWLLNTQFIGGSYFDELPRTYVISYVNGDDALYWFPSFDKIIEGYNMLAKEDEQVSVLFPLANIKKSWFYEALSPLYGLMTWCEVPVLTKNCDCTPCQRHRYELSKYDA